MRQKRPLYIVGAYEAGHAVPVMTACGWTEADARALLLARLKDAYLNPYKLEIRVNEL